jgi:hypothetical protein
MKKITILLLFFYSVASAQLELPYAVKNVNNRPIDHWYYNPATLAPWANTAAILASATRIEGQLYYVASGDVYTFKGGILDANLLPISASGGGDMVLAGTQTNTGLKTFLNGTLGMRNVANTFTSQFTNTNTAARTYTLPNFTGNVLVSGNGGVNTMTGNLIIDSQTTGSGDILIGDINSPRMFFANFTGDDSQFSASTYNSANTISSFLSIYPEGYIFDNVGPGFSSRVFGGLSEGTELRFLQQTGPSGQINLGKNVSGANNSFALYTNSSGGSISDADLRMNINGSTWTMNYGSDATGGIPYRNASGNEVRLPIGTSGQVMTVSGGIPAWTTLGAGGGGISNATDADFTAITNGGYNILDGVATANRVITIPTGANGDILKFFNTEDNFTWTFAGETVYLADRVTVVTQLLFDVPCFMERIDGRWIITN